MSSNKYQKPENVTLNCRIPKQLYERLALEANSHEVSLASVVRQALDESLPQVKRISIGDGEPMRVVEERSLSLEELAVIQKKINRELTDSNIRLNSYQSPLKE